MNSQTVEQLHAGTVYLYSALTKREFYENLEIFLAQLYGDARFSVLVPSSRRGRLAVDYSSAFDAGLEGTPCDSELLESVLRSGRDRSFFPGTAPVVRLGTVELGVYRSKVLAGDEEHLALLVFHDHPVGDISEEERKGVESYVFDHVAMAFQKIRERDVLSEGLEESLIKLEALRRIGSLLGTFDLEALLSQLIEVCLVLTDAEVGSIELFEPVRCSVEWGMPSSILACLQFKDGTSMVDSVRESGRSLLIPEFEGHPDCAPMPLFRVDSFLSVPLLSKERVLGTINLIRSGDADRRFSEKDRAAIVTISSLAGTAIENAYLHREAVEKEKIEANLKIAQSIQRGMYPTGALEIPGYDTACYNQSCEETGGDYFDFVTLSPGKLALAVGDVSGHGIGAALLMAAGRANLRALLSVREELQEVAERLNNLLEGDMDAEKFMTLFLGCLDFRAHRLAYVNAGHDAPLHYRAGPEDVADLESTGVPLGMFPGVSYALAAVDRIAAGDALLFTTDGVWEVTNRSGERYGKQRLRERFRAAARDGARAVVEAISSDVNEFCEGVPPRDDRTLVVLKRLGGP